MTHNSYNHDNTNHKHSNSNNTDRPWGSRREQWQRSTSGGVEAEIEDPGVRAEIGDARPGVGPKEDLSPKSKNRMSRPARLKPKTPASAHAGLKPKTPEKTHTGLTKSSPHTIEPEMLVIHLHWTVWKKHKHNNNPQILWVTARNVKLAQLTTPNAIKHTK